MRPVRARYRLLLVSVALCLGVTACAEGEAPTRDHAPTASAAPSVQRQPVDAALIAFLSKARAAHHQADLAETKEDVKGAIGFLEAIPNGTLPKQGPEVIEVLADAHARLGDLKSRDGRFDDAAKEVDRGLALAKETTHFRGHLFEVRGVIEERRMEALAKAGDTAGAEKAKQAALAAFEKAVEIQDAVISKALEGMPTAVPANGAAPSASALPK
jgi:tetratricopeptide (TPR) repeat protein